MYQKTFLSRNVNELKEKLPNIRKEFAAFEDGSITTMVANLTESEVCETVGLLKEYFPKFKINGMSSGGMITYGGNKDIKILYLKFVGMTESKTVFLGKCFERFSPTFVKDSLEYAKELREEIKRIDDVKGVEIYFAWLKYSVSEFIDILSEGLEDIPIFGAVAHANSIDFVNGYVAVKDDDAIVINSDFIGSGVSAVVYSGKDLYVYSEYLLGWKPVGKYMDVSACEVTDEGRTLLCSLDNEKPLDIYYKYLGVRPNKFFVANIGEFPLIVERNGVHIARTPSGYAENGMVYLEGDLQPGEKVRFSYGDYEEILAETRNAAGRMAAFGAENLSLIICGNRFSFLQDDYKIEVEYYSEGRIEAPYLIFGMGEIHKYQGKGGMLNSALVAVGMREGLGSEQSTFIQLPKVKHVHEGVIPLHERLSHFLKAMTGELVDAVKEAKAANEAKSNFLSNMSHEIRTPINAVLGMDEMILRECEDHQLLEYAQNIKVAGNTLLSLVNDILDFSKIEAGKMDIVNVDYDFSSVINDLVNMIKPRAGAKNLKLIADIDKNIPSVLNGDEIRLKQVITNILTNAVKYTEKGSVTLKIRSEKTAEDEAELAVSVKDTGIGIREEDIEKMFAAFQRVDEVRNRNVEGTGLGLDITRRLLELMGSSLEVESKYGSGSDFHFVIRQKVIKWEPIGDYMESYKKSLENRENYHERFTSPESNILVVDDTPMNLEVFEGLLKKTLVNIDKASSGMECLEKSRLKKYDIIFLDHRMPEMDGIETLQKLKEEKDNPNHDTITISLTANAVSGARKQYIAAGFNDYLTKPIMSDKLESMMLQYLPGDKVKIADSDSEEKKDDDLLPDWLMEVEKLDRTEGIRNCGSADVFLNAVESFAGSAKENYELINEYLNNNNIRDYTIKVHALKSSARIIGAPKLSELAEKLEKAGDMEDTALIREKTPELLRLYKELSDEINEKKKELTADKDDLPLIETSALEEAIESVKELSASFDYDSVKYIVDSLNDYRVPEESEEKIKRLKTAVAHADWDEIGSVLSDLG